MSANILIQFIGGPKNTQQEYHNKQLLQIGDTHTFIVDMGWVTTSVPGLNDRIDCSALQATYRFFRIPKRETPFSEEEIVIGIFQE